MNLVVLATLSWVDDLKRQHVSSTIPAALWRRCFIVKLMNYAARTSLARPLAYVRICQNSLRKPALSPTAGCLFQSANENSLVEEHSVRFQKSLSLCL